MLLLRYLIKRIEIILLISFHLGFLFKSLFGVIILIIVVIYDVKIKSFVNAKYDDEINAWSIISVKSINGI